MGFGVACLSMVPILFVIGVVFMVPLLFFAPVFLVLGVLGLTCPRRVRAKNSPML